MSDLDAHCYCGFVGQFDICPSCGTKRTDAFRHGGLRGRGPVIAQSAGEAVRASGSRWACPDVFMELSAEAMLPSGPIYVSAEISGDAQLAERVSPWPLAVAA